MLKLFQRKTKIFFYTALNDFLRKIIKIRFQSNKSKMTFIGNHYSGYWIPEILLRKPGSIYGVGLGADSSFEFELVKLGYVFWGFEPEYSSYVKSKLQFSSSKSIVFNYGLSNINGNFVSRGDNFSIAKTYSHKPVNSQIFEIRSLWEVTEGLELKNAKRPRVLKMNIEGAEREILRKFILDPLPFEIVIFQAEFLFHLRFFQFHRRLFAFIELWKILKGFEKLNWRTIHLSKNQITISNLALDQLKFSSTND